MLLANSSVSGKAATGHVLKVRSHRRLSPNTRSSSKIITPNRGSWGFSERTLEVLTNLSCWRFVFYSITDNGIDSLLSPLRGTPTAYLNAPLACFLAYVKYASTLCFACAPFLAPKSLRQIGNPWFLKRTLEVYTNLSCWRFVFCWNGEGRGIEVLAKPIFVRGVSPFNGSAFRTFQWLARLAFALHRFVSPLFRIQKYCVKSGSWGLGNELRKC